MKFTSFLRLLPTVQCHVFNGFIGESKLPTGVLAISPCDLHLDSRPMVAGIRSSTPATLLRLVKGNRWMNEKKLQIFKNPSFMTKHQDSLWA